jgi:hypothetical protein
LGFFVLIIVGVVVAQTWHDWRKNIKDWVVPDWARGIALGGVLAASITALASFATTWMEDSSSQMGGILASRVFWPQAGLVVISAAIIVLMARKRRFHWLFLLAGMVLAAFWVGMTLGS